MNRRLLFLVFVLLGLLWLSLRLGDNLDPPAQQAAQTGKMEEGGRKGEGDGQRRDGGDVGERSVIRNIQILPSAPTLQSRLHVVSDSPRFNPLAHRYRWFVNQNEVGQGETLSLATFRQGDIVSVEMTPKDAADTVSPATASVKIGNNPPVVREIRLTPLPVSAGEAVRAEVMADDPEHDFIQLTYEWQINGKPIQNDRDTLEGSSIHSADTLLVFVTPSDPFAKGVRQTSPLVTVLNRSPEILSTPPRLDNNGVYRYPVIARDPDGDPLYYRLLEAPPGMNVDEAGIISWSVTLLPTRKAGVSIEVHDGKGGKVAQQFTMQTAPPSGGGNPSLRSAEGVDLRP